MSAGFRDRVAEICGTLPGAEVSDPWGGGHDAWKVGDKMFACIGAVAEGVSIKCLDIETAEMLKDVGAAMHAPYFHNSWVRLPENVDTGELRERLELSYDIVRSKLPAKVRKTLPERQIEGSG